MPINLGGLAGGFAENAGEHLLEFSLGAAVAEALRPEAVELGQEAWKVNPSRVVDPRDAAAIVAEAVELMDWGKGEAEASGINGERFAAIVNEALRAPAFAELLRLWRRGAITQADFEHGLRKGKLEGRWDGALAELKTDRLDPAVIATAGQRGVMDDAGLLPVGPPTAVGKVPPMPVSGLDTIAEAAASGVDRERLAVLMRIVGLPPSPGELFQLLNRGTIEEADFRRGIAEGNTRNEWADVLLELRHRLLTPHEYVELRLRGWIDDAAMHAGAARSGLSSSDADLLFKMLGRPIPVHQVTTGLARGGHYNEGADAIPEAYVRSLEESNVRPEWYGLAYANRYSYPSAFVVRQLQRDAALTRDEAEQIYLRVGYPPELAAKVADAYTPTGAGKADPHIGKAQTHLWTAVHRAFVNDEATEAQALAALGTLEVAAAARPQVVELWKAERELVRAWLTPAQVKKALGHNLIDHAEALSRLEAIGMPRADAELLLAE